MYKNYIFIFLIALVFSAVDVMGQVTQNGWKEERQIYQKVYDAKLVMDEQRSTTILQLAQTKPLIIALVFTRCTGVCSPFLLQLKENLQLIGKKNFNVLVISFDVRDSLKDMAMLAQIFDLKTNPQWTFAVTGAIDSLNNSIGFDPVWDAKRQQFEHDAIAVGVNTEGIITKKLIGMRNSKDLELLIKSSEGEFSPSYRLPGKSNLFSCFNYNPQTGKNMPGLGLLFILLPAVITFLLLVFINLLAKNYRT
ncbi:hypothetical protein [Agriterribacter sp.]|uniref:hypothetical protein n=1 Tax=Agriterribacter sp. TaxID=2821509 RepID=UPI002CC13384|nr:hypothetical protein [Agriterribacter sp.]HTN06549.1 hypothetical protein [Agriterribacter sp.]